MGERRRALYRTLAETFDELAKLEEGPEIPAPADSEKRITVDELAVRDARKLLAKKGIRTK